MKKLLLLTVSILFVVACAKNSIVTPSWIMNPAKDGYIVGVGACGTHIKGKTGQRQLATARAIDEIARQLGVVVKSELAVSTSVSNNSSISTNSSSFSIQSVDGKNVVAKIVDTWLDPRTNEFYVYMQAKE